MNARRIQTAEPHINPDLRKQRVEVMGLLSNTREHRTAPEWPNLARVIDGGTTFAAVTFFAHQDAD